MFKKAIVRKPCKNMVRGITSANLGKPDYVKALKQHEKYIEALEDCGLKVIRLEEDENFPDSVFVEDTAVLTGEMAVITNPGDKSRNNEKALILPVIQKYYSNIEEIKFPGILDGGDVMMTENHFYIGISERTNLEGALQFIEILKKYYYSGSTVNLDKMLHLKTGVNYIEKNNLLVCGEFEKNENFQLFNRIIVPEKEAYAANSLWINENVLVPQGFDLTKNIIRELGYNVIEVDVSEFQKLDGGLSCLSLRF